MHSAIPSLLSSCLSKLSRVHVVLVTYRYSRDASGALPVLSRVDAATGLHHLSVGYNAETDSYSPFFFQHPTVDTGLAASIGNLVKVS